MSNKPLLYGPNNKPIQSIQSMVEKHVDSVAQIEKQEKNRVLANALFKALLGQPVAMVEDDPRFTGLVKIDPTDFYIEIESFPMDGYRDPFYRAKIMGVVEGQKDYLVSTMKFVHHLRYVVEARAGNMLPCMPMKFEYDGVKGKGDNKVLHWVEFKYPYWNENRVKIVLTANDKRQRKEEKRQRDYNKSQEAYRKKHGIDSVSRGAAGIPDAN